MSRSRTGLARSISAVIVVLVVTLWPWAVPRAAITVGTGADSCFDADGNSGTTSTCTVTNVSVNDVIVCGGSNYQTRGPWSFTDDRESGWPALPIDDTHTNNTQRTAYSYKQASNSGTYVVTGTIGGSSGRTDRWMACTWVRGVNTTADDIDSAEGADGTTVTGPTVTCSTSSCIVVAFTGFMSNQPIAATGSFTELEENENSCCALGGFSYRAVGNGNVTPTWSKGNAGSSLGENVSAAIVLSESSGAGAPCNRLFLLLGIARC